MRSQTAHTPIQLITLVGHQWTCGRSKRVEGSFEVLLKSYGAKMPEEMVFVWYIGRRAGTKVNEKIGDLGGRRKCFEEPYFLRVLHVSF